MRTSIYWMTRHLRDSIRRRRFHARCWWIGHQVEFLEWRLRWEPVLSSMQSPAELASVAQGGFLRVISPGTG